MPIAAEQQSSRAAEQQSSRAAEQQSSRAAELNQIRYSHGPHTPPRRGAFFVIPLSK